jgi:hypothetical protein
MILFWFFVPRTYVTTDEHVVQESFGVMFDAAVDAYLKENQ